MSLRKILRHRSNPIPLNKGKTMNKKLKDGWNSVLKGLGGKRDTTKD